jgi:hypothetical protein
MSSVYNKADIIKLIKNLNNTLKKWKGIKTIKLKSLKAILRVYNPHHSKMGNKMLMIFGH